MGICQLWGRARISARFFAIATLLAFAWQSIVTQSHVHFDTRTTPAAVHNLQSIQYRNAPGDQPGDCPICRQFAHAGHYLSPDAFTFAALAAAAIWLAIGLPAAWIGRRRSHAWHSRGPPPHLRT